MNIEQPNNEKLLISGLKFPEGPVFDSVGNLWFVEIHGGNLSKWDGENLTRYPVDGTPNGAAIDKHGIIWFCDSGRGEIRTFNPQTESFQTICNTTSDGQNLKKPNDLIFDSVENLIFSDHADGREELISTICVLPKGEKIATIISKNKRFTNGLALTKDEKKLIFAETYNQSLWVGDWNVETAEFSNEKLFAKAGNGPFGPDGIAFDNDENLFVTVFNEHVVLKYNTKGEIINSICCMGSRPTSCAFDPFDRWGLVVTEAERGEIICFSRY
ncbi:MAG: SMP-30/gluconolactonase/LRE family protein [Paludibacter sp.]